MKFVFYTHSLISDWNHGNAHFQRGVMRELQSLGHEVVSLEPEDGWSRTNLLAEQGEAATAGFARAYPSLRPSFYGTDCDHAAMVDDADVVIVHEWTEPALVARLGRLRRSGGRFTLAFHDTHHRALSAESDIAALELEDFDLILVFGEVLRERYLARGWGHRVVTWHEAADARLFKPVHEPSRDGDLVWIGNWGDGERSAELRRFLIEPARHLGLKTTVHGVRYPQEVVRDLKAAGFSFGGWLANTDVPTVYARHRVTMHVPRRPYVEALPGIPTIRVFEALACGIPLVSAPWDDAEGLFTPGRDFLVARDGHDMVGKLRAILADAALAEDLALNGRETILARHTCRHRVDELFGHLEQHGAERVRAHERELLQP